MIKGANAGLAAVCPLQLVAAADCDDSIGDNTVKAYGVELCCCLYALTVIAGQIVAVQVKSKALIHS